MTLNATLRFAALAAAAMLLAADSAHVTAQEEVRGAAEVADVEVIQDEIDAEEMAEEDAELEVQVVGNPWGVETNQLMGAKRFQLKQLFLVEVEQLERICDLNKKQQLKLRIAAKGAVKKLTAAWSKKMAQQMGQVAQPKQADKDKAEAPEAVEFVDADEIDENVIQMMTMNGFSGNPYKSDDPVASRFWKKTVSNVLTEAQLEKLAKHKQVQRRAKRVALVDYTISVMRVELSLSEDQTVKIDKIIRPILMKAEIDCVALYEPYLVYYYASKSDTSEVAKLLSPPQLQKWKIFMAPMKQIGQVMEMENGDFGIVGENEGFLILMLEVMEAIAQGINSWLATIFG